MSQHTIKILNYPDAPGEETFVTRAVGAYARARAWSEAATAGGLENLLYQGDRVGCQKLIRKVRTRQILAPEVAEDVRWLAEACGRRIGTLTDHDAPATRAKATLLNESALELHALAAAIDEALDLEKALEMRHRIGRSASSPGK